MSKHLTVDDGQTALNPYEAVKRKIFLVAVPAGVVSMLLVWVATMKQNALSRWDLYALPSLAAAFLVLALLLWRRMIPLHIFELAVYVLVMLYAVSEFLSVLIDTIVTHATFT